MGSQISVLHWSSYGGIFERVSREYTLDDFHSLQLDKLDRYVCLKASDVVIPDGEEESSDEDDDEDDEDGEDEDDEDEETEGEDGSDFEETHADAGMSSPTKDDETKSEGEDEVEPVRQPFSFMYLSDLLSGG